VAITHHIAPATFRDNLKTLSHFEQTELLCFDFDSGKHKSEDIHKTLGELNHVILASKNHLKDKNDGKGIIERYHVFVPVDEAITDYTLYRYTIKKIGELAKWDIDNTCKDASHYYFKHSIQLYIKTEGKNMEIQRFIEHKAKDDAREMHLKKLKSLEAQSSKYKLSDAISYVDKYLKPSVSGNGGHSAAFGAACLLLNKFPSDIAFEAFEHYNRTKCSPEWSDKDLLHKFESAKEKI